ncbi:MAG: ubiquitin-conjugating enzyme E2 [Promethearchaeota archaeon]
MVSNKGFLDESTLETINEDIVFEMMINASGFVKINEDDNITLEPKSQHRVKVKIKRQFPYAGGIEIKWISSIFHPNLDPLEHKHLGGGTGYVCLNILKKWSKLSDLKTTVHALKMLVENPNAGDPLNYPQCLEAAEYFKAHPVKKEIEEKEDIVIL